MSFLGCSLQREGASRSGRGGQEVGGEAGVVPGPAGLTHPTAETYVASGISASNRPFTLFGILIVPTSIKFHRCFDVCHVT